MDTGHGAVYSDDDEELEEDEEELYVIELKGLYRRLK